MKHRTFIIGILVIIAALFATPVFAASEYIAYTLQDTYIQEHNPDANFNYSDAIFVSSDEAPSDWTQRGLLEMDISGLPEGVTITGATLRLYYYGWIVADPVGRTLWAYKLTRNDWVETEVTWNSYQTGETWTSPGSDFVTSDPLGGAAVIPADSPTWVEWEIVGIVGDAYANGENVELLLKFETETDIDTSTKFYGFEYEDTIPPELHIQYTEASTPAGNSILRLFLLPIVAIGIIIAVIGAWAKNPYIFFMGIIMGIVAFIVVQKLIEALL